MNKRCLKLGLTALLSGLTLIAWAGDPVAVLQQPQGKVFVSQGEVMVPVQDSLPLYTGNRVIVISGGRAKIAYAGGCVVALPENSLLTVRGADQCRLRQSQVRTIGGFQSTRIGQLKEPEPLVELRQPQGDVFVGQTKIMDNQWVHRDNQIVVGTESQVTAAFPACEATMGPNEDKTVDELRSEKCPDSSASSKPPVVKQLLGTALVDHAPVRAGTEVQGNNRITTGADGQVTVVFGGCEILLDEPMEIEMNDLAYRCSAALLSAGTAAAAESAVGVIGFLGAPAIGFLGVAAAGGILSTLPDSSPASAE